MSLDVELPMYINENSHKYFLTISADIQDYWNIGYSTNGETYLEWSAIGKNESIDEALRNLAGAYKRYKDTQNDNPRR